MPTFSLNTKNGKHFHGAYSTNSLEIKGAFSVQGPQPICEEGCPQWVADIFDRLPGVERIAIDGNGKGVVWSRLKEYRHETDFSI